MYFSKSWHVKPKRTVIIMQIKTVLHFGAYIWAMLHSGSPIWKKQWEILETTSRFHSLLVHSFLSLLDSSVLSFPGTLCKVGEFPVLFCAEVWLIMIIFSTCEKQWECFTKKGGSQRRKEQVD